MSISKNKTKPKKAKKRRNPIHAYKKLLANDHDWDYAYLIALEKKKLQRMRDCIKQEHHLANNEFVVRDMGICIRLIDIFIREFGIRNQKSSNCFEFSTCTANASGLLSKKQ